MGATRLDYHIGDHLHISEDDETKRLWRIIERADRKWRLEPVGGGDTKSLSDDEVRYLRCKGRLQHFSSNPQGLDPDRAELLRLTFDAHEPELRNIAERKALYCRRVDEKRQTEHLSLDECYLIVPQEVFDEYHDRWVQQDAELELLRRADRKKRSRLPQPIDAPIEEQPSLAPPYPCTLEAWYRSWVEVGRDIRILIPLYKNRGNFTPRKEARVYEFMDFYIRTFYLTEKQTPLTFAYRELKKIFKNEGIYVSYETIRTFKNKRWSEFEEDRKRTNWRKAYLKHDVFIRVRPPENALDEVEIDHCLIDLIVVDELSGRPLGRPWLTVMLDRATRMILGCHISFEVPSFASLQRCLAHAFWPKNLEGLNLANDWPCEGIPKRIFIDNGREFLSRSLERASVALGFTIINLPVRVPWLKGCVERIFGTTNTKVFDHEDGKTFSNVLKRGEYNPIKNARLTMPQLRQKLINYFVDDYHVTPHPALGMTPLEAWHSKTDAHGVNSVRLEEDLVPLLGYSTLRPIGRSGIRLLGLYYYSEELRALRRRRGGRCKRFEIRIDPYDIGELRILDEDEGRWLTVPCDHPELAVGVSMHQARVHIRMAKTMTKGGIVTEDDLYEGRYLAKTESDNCLAERNAKTTASRIARYALPNGQFMTPVAGFTGLSAANDTLSTSESEESYNEPTPVEPPEPEPERITLDLSAAVATRVSQLRGRP